MPLRILVVDDHAVVRRGVRSLLESHEGWEVCGEATTGRDAVEQSRHLRPDVVVMDLSLPELNGLDATRQILKEAAQFCAQIATTLVYVPILPPGAHMRETSYDIEANIERYNGIVAEILPPRQIVDLSEVRAEIDRFVLQDGHHLNALGHEKCADQICRSLSQLGFAA